MVKRHDNRRSAPRLRSNERAYSSGACAHICCTTSCSPTGSGCEYDSGRIGIGFSHEGMYPASCILPPLLLFMLIPCVEQIDFTSPCHEESRAYPVFATCVHYTRAYLKQYDMHSLYKNGKPRHHRGDLRVVQQLCELEHGIAVEALTVERMQLLVLFRLFDLLQHLRRMSSLVTRLRIFDLDWIDRFICIRRMRRKPFGAELADPFSGLHASMLLGSLSLAEITETVSILLAHRFPLAYRIFERFFAVKLPSSGG